MFLLGDNRLDWLNYHHLFYFWQVVKEGSIQAASRKLGVTPSTISTQLKSLEGNLDRPLLARVGRRLEPTKEGLIAMRYANEIFSLGREMKDTLAGKATGQPLRLRVGAAMVVPKLVVYRILAPAFEMEEPVHLICSENRPDRLLAELALHTLDVVLMDSPIPAGSTVRAFNHPLGGCGVSLFAHPDLIERYGTDLPGSLDGAPFLLPTEHAAMRRALERWFRRCGIQPRIIAEFQDSALMKVYGEAGKGFFASPTLIASDIVQHYGVQHVMDLDEVQERFYAITLDRRITNPAIASITDNARAVLQGVEAQDSHAA